ncbi:MlaE family ABC transporter permease [Syntrophorhabdus aromaticivorans]|uniref:ABC transporter permease n=1 Tax=Syntrophorhabdus aromaticivorans TaxID=328301 RepID=A0A971M4F4_9BACT|nr:ABC transporter permease [Syntrophorhabdus aromaticivorans]NLW35122.1 ABC transporter permease [Syntrophorhabdus aromaticivorans]
MQTMIRGLISPIETFVRELGRVVLMFAESVYWGVRRPFKLDYIFKQMEFIGVNSTVVVIITGMFTGMVLALQSYYGFRKFGAEGLVGATVALSMTRELGPVLTSLMVTGRAGSAMAAQLGTMRVTEQIDALTVMALSPIKYLVTPRIVAGFLMLPVLTVVSDFIGVVGGYVVGVKLLGINEGAFIDKMIKYVELNDIYNGLVKSAVFGIILSSVACYKGFYARGGAEGVGKATTEAVVVSSVTILISDYVLTSLMF